MALVLRHRFLTGAAQFFAGKIKMSWLSDLEEYAAPYESQLQTNRFYKVDAIDGPGMGAGIEYANRIFDIALVNDRGQFFIYFLNARFFSRLKAGFLFRCETNFYSKRIAFGAILAIAEAFKTEKDFSALNFQEKSDYWNINPSLEDPLATFFDNLPFIVEMLKRTTSKKLRRWIDDYYKDIHKWL
ncbi:MAG TPA: hypothetical protein VGJ15_07630, partial [Pirellulales bacterium]